MDKALLFFTGIQISKIYKRKLKKFNEDVQHSIKQTNCVFQDQNVYKEHVKYAKGFQEKLLEYTYQLGVYSRQLEDQMGLRFLMLLKGLQHVNTEMEGAGNQMLGVVPHHNPNSSPGLQGSSHSLIMGSRGTQATKPDDMFEDEESRRFIADFHILVLDEVKKNMQKYYENCARVEMVKIATRDELTTLCESAAETVSQTEVKSWIKAKLELKYILLTPQMSVAIKEYVDRQMKKRLPLHRLIYVRIYLLIYYGLICCCGKEKINIKTGNITQKHFRALSFVFY
jgi:hypothetical protein